MSYKSGLISSLLYRAFKLCSNFETFHKEIIFLNDIFKRNGYLPNVNDKCVKTFLDKIFIDKKVFSVAQKKELICDLPFIGKKVFTSEIPIRKVHTTKFEILHS